MSREEDIKKLGELMKDVRIAMMTTKDAEGDMHSRPMALQHTEFDGDLWFFTGKNSGKAAELQLDQHVNISFAEVDDNKFVSVSGRARLVEDRDKAKELWNPLYKVWFPEGLDDPNLALLKVSVEKAEYWDSPHGVVTYLAGFVKVLTTGKSPEHMGDHAKLELTH